jgi:DnaK suppressor protein
MDIDTQANLTTLRDALTNRLRELQAEVQAAADTRRGRDEEVAPGDVSDRKDEAARRVLSEVGDAEAQRDMDELAQVEHALQRLERGTYGDCVQCGEPIPLQRLRVQPAAERCAPCQASFERGGAARPQTGP